MGLQEEAMRKNANKLYGACQDKEGWYGFEEVNHPTPSGCERWLMTYSDKRRWPDGETAILEIKKALGA
jgi:hypothetical protein